jgi:hypothetical protein
LEVNKNHSLGKCHSSIASAFVLTAGVSAFDSSTIDADDGPTRCSHGTTGTLYFLGYLYELEGTHG